MLDGIILIVAYTVLAISRMIAGTYKIRKTFYLPEKSELDSTQFKFRRSKNLYRCEIEAVKQGCNFRCTLM